MEEILSRFEQGDLRPDESEYHRPRSSRRRPPPTRADREALREHRLHSDQVKKPAQKKLPAARKKVRRAAIGDHRKAPLKSRKGARRAA